MFAVIPEGINVIQIAFWKSVIEIRKIGAKPNFELHSRGSHVRTGVVLRG